MATGLSVSRVVSINVNLSPSGTQVPSLNTFMIAGSSDVIDTTSRVRVYQSLAGVAADFGTSAAEYAAAALWFGQTPAPSQLTIGRWAQTATAGRVVGTALSAAQQQIANFTTVTNGGFKIAVDGGALTNVTGISLAGVTNLNGVASAINAALTSATVGATATWDGSRFTIKSATTGTTSSVSTLAAPTAGTALGPLMHLDSASLPVVANGVAPESAVAAIAVLDSAASFYGFTFAATLVDADVLALAGYAQGAVSLTPHTYWPTLQGAGVLDPASTTDVAYLLNAGGFYRTMAMYSSTNAYAGVSLAAKALSVDYTQANSTITLKFKTLPGVVPENLSLTATNAVEAKGCNVYATYLNGASIAEQGAAEGSYYIDEITGTDWLAIALQTAGFNALLTSPKVPQTDAGMSVLAAVYEGVCVQGVTNGLMAARVWTGPSFGTIKTGDTVPKGYYIYQPPIALQSVGDRAARKSVAFTIGANLAGAVHSSTALINVNR